MCESCSLFRWQLLYGTVDLAQQLVLAEPVHMIVVVHRRLMSRHTRHGSIAVASLSYVVQGRVGRDLVQPGAIVGISLKSVVGTIGSEKRLLTEILCLSVVTHHAEDVPKYLRLMAFHEVIEDWDFGHGTSLPVAFAVHLDMTREGQFREVKMAAKLDRKPPLQTLNPFVHEREIMTFVAHLNGV